MINIFGVNHRVQHSGYLDSEAQRVINEFVDIIACFMGQHEIDLIAEEFNQEACRRNGVPCSILCDISNEHSLAHVYLELDNAERSEANIESSDFDARENEWIRRLRLQNFQNSIVVIGLDHVQSFIKKLRENGMPHQVIQTDIGNSYNPLGDFFRTDI